MKKQVTITLERNTYFVRYVGRQKFQRYSAAQFYAPDTTLERVRVTAWVKAQHNLELVESERAS